MKSSGLFSHWANSLKTLSLLPSSHIFLISSETLYCPLELGSTTRLILRSIAPWLKAGGGGIWRVGEGTVIWEGVFCSGTLSGVGGATRVSCTDGTVGVSFGETSGSTSFVAGVSTSCSVAAADLVDFGVSSKENR